MLTFLPLVPEPSPPWTTELIQPNLKEQKDQPDVNDYFTNYDIGKFLCNYETSSVDSMSIDSDCESDLDVDLDDVDYPRRGALLHLLTNSLVFSHVAPFVSAADKVHLAATSKAFYSLVHGTPYAFKYLDLTRWQRSTAQSTTSSTQHGRNSEWCEPEYSLGPYHDVFTSLHNSRWLSSVNTLILDNTNVDVELVSHLLTSPSCNVRILSLRNTPSLNKEALCSFLKVLCSQDHGAVLKLKGLYLFGNDETETSDLWYRKHGRIMTPSKEAVEGNMWADLLMYCHGKIAFDGVLCNGPRHAISSAHGKVSGIDVNYNDLDLRRIPLSRLPPGRPDTQASMATFSLGGCAGCGSAPEGWTTWGDDHAAASQFPLLWPPPRLSTKARVAMCPDGESVRPHRTHHHGNNHSSPSRFIPRCEWCVYGRLCACCMRWWCESCLPDSAAHGLEPVDGDVSHKVRMSMRFECCSSCPSRPCTN